MELLATNISMILVIKNLRLPRIFPLKGSSDYENLEKKITGRGIFRIFFLHPLYASSFSWKNLMILRICNSGKQSSYAYEENQTFLSLRKLYVFHVWNFQFKVLQLCIKSFKLSNVLWRQKNALNFYYNLQRVISLSSFSIVRVKSKSFAGIGISGKFC